MIQQSNIPKHSGDDHYCNSLYCYSCELTQNFKKCIRFLITDDKNKIKVGELSSPVFVIAHCKKVLVAQGRIPQAVHHFGSITVISTVVT